MPEANGHEGDVDEAGAPEAGGWREFLRPSLRQVLVGVLLAALSFTMTVQLTTKNDDDYAGVREDDLVELLKSLDSANERVSSQIDELSSTRDKLLTTTKRSQEAEKQAKERAGQLGILAGTTGATGPGVRLVISDPKKEVGAAQLLDAVEELRDAGAEAVVVNGTARVVAQTAFTDDGSDVRIGTHKVSRPYVVEAIGDASTMAAAMTFRGGLSDRIDSRGGSLNVKKVGTITISALADVATPEYAQSGS